MRRSTIELSDAWAASVESFAWSNVEVREMNLKDVAGTGLIAGLIAGPQLDQPPRGRPAGWFPKTAMLLIGAAALQFSSWCHRDCDTRHDDRLHVATIAITSGDVDSIVRNITSPVAKAAVAIVVNMWKEAGYRLLGDAEDGDVKPNIRQKILPWLGHAVLLSLSFGFLISGLWIRNTAWTSRPGDAAPIYCAILFSLNQPTDHTEYFL